MEVKDGNKTLYCTVKVTGRAPMKVFKIDNTNLYEIEFMRPNNTVIKAGGIDATECLRYISDYVWER